MGILLVFILAGSFVAGWNEVAGIVLALCGPVVAHATLDLNREPD
jgi:hypothetical protein